MRATTTVVFCAIDNLIGVTSKALTGFPAFLEGLGDANVPFVPVTARSRIQFDASLRKFRLGHPFIAEGGCGVYLPEDYFHLKPTASNSADIGSRVGTGIRPHVKTEGEMAYDFDQAITRVAGDLARGIELAAWRVWAQTGTS